MCLLSAKTTDGLSEYTLFKHVGRVTIFRIFKLDLFMYLQYRDRTVSLEIMSWTSISCWTILHQIKSTGSGASYLFHSARESEGVKVRMVNRC